MPTDDRRTVTRNRRLPPHVPSGCRNCTIRDLTICRAAANDTDILQRFKTGDRIAAAQTHLYSMGDRPSELFNLLDGWVALYRILESGQRQILDIVVPGGFLGYQPDLGAPMSHGALCLTDVAVCIFPRRKFPELLERHPAFMRAMLDTAAAATAQAQDHLTNVGARSATARVASMLVDLHRRSLRRFPSAGRGPLELPLTQDLVADSVGLTTVYVNRILRDLRERGLLQVRPGRLQVLDADALSRHVEKPTAVEPAAPFRLLPRPISPLPADPVLLRKRMPE